jgi:hypothetical protein
VVNVFDVSPTFNLFNPADGTLTAASLTWSASGSLSVSGNFQGQAIMSYETSSQLQGWNINGGSTTVNFSISGTESAVAGNGDRNRNVHARSF